MTYIRMASICTSSKYNEGKGKTRGGKEGKTINEDTTDWTKTMAIKPIRNSRVYAHTHSHARPYLGGSVRRHAYVCTQTLLIVTLCTLCAQRHTIHLEIKISFYFSRCLYFMSATCFFRCCLFFSFFRRVLKNYRSISCSDSNNVAKDTRRKGKRARERKRENVVPNSGNVLVIRGIEASKRTSFGTGVEQQTDACARGVHVLSRHFETMPDKRQHYCPLLTLAGSIVIRESCIVSCHINADPSATGTGVSTPICICDRQWCEAETESKDKGLIHVRSVCKWTWKTVSLCRRGLNLSGRVSVSFLPIVRRN